MSDGKYFSTTKKGKWLASDCFYLKGQRSKRTITTSLIRTKFGLSEGLLLTLRLASMQ